MRNDPHTTSDDSPVEEVETDVPPAMSSDYECLGFDDPSFSTIHSRDDTATTAKVGGGEGDEEKDDSL